MANIPPKPGDDLNKGTASLFTVLLAERCKQEAQQALKFEGARTFETSFQVLREVAAQGLMTDPSVINFMTGLENHLDTELLENTFDIK